MYEYHATVPRVVDGDTVDVVIDLGLGTSRLERLRLFGIDSPETRGDEREAGLAAKQWLEAQLDMIGFKVVVKTYKEVTTDKDKKGKFGRYLADIFAPVQVHGESINQRMVRAGHAKAASY